MKITETEPPAQASEQRHFLKLNATGPGTCFQIGAPRPWKRENQTSTEGVVKSYMDGLFIASAVRLIAAESRCNRSGGDTGP